jgi:tyrosinase
LVDRFKFLTSITTLEDNPTVTMRFSPTVALAPLLAVSAASSLPAITIDSDILAAKGLLNLATYQITQLFAGVKQTCTLANAAVRREW